LVANGIWYSVAFQIIDSTHYLYYLNGKLIRSGTFGTAINTNDSGTNYIGAKGNTFNIMYGVIDETILDNSLWSNQKIKTYYQAKYGKLE
jgi:hypothetical protein